MPTSKMIWQTVFFLSLLAASPQTGFTQSFDKGFYSPEETGRFQSSCADGHQLLLLRGYSQWAQALHCLHQGPFLDFTLSGVPERAYEPIFGYQSDGFSFHELSELPADVAVLVNPAVFEAGLISLPEGPFLAGLTTSVFVQTPSQAMENYGYSVTLVRPDAMTVDGAILERQQWFLDSVSKGMGQVEFPLRLPLTPGSYFIEVRDQAGFVVDKKPVTVAPNLPFVEFNVPEIKTWEEGSNIQLEIGFTTETPPDVSINFHLLRKDIRGKWVSGGSVQPHEVYASNKMFAQLPPDGEIFVRPEAGGRHRIIAVQTGYPGAQQIQIGELEFDVPQPELPDYTQIIISPGHRVFDNERIVFTPIKVPDYMSEPYKIDLYRYSPPLGRNLNRIPRGLEDGKPLLRWEIYSGDHVEFPSDLGPGEYAVFLRADHSQLEDLNNRVMAMDEFTVLASSGYSLSVDKKNMLMGERQIVHVELPAGQSFEDPRYSVSVVHLGGWVPGCATQLPTGFIYPKPRDGVPMGFPNISDGAPPPPDIAGPL